MMADAERLILALARVRTPEGARYYGQPIGSIIRPDAPKLPDAISSLESIANSVEEKYRNARWRDAYGSRGIKKESYSILGRTPTPVKSLDFSVNYKDVKASPEDHAYALDFLDTLYMKRDSPGNGVRLYRMASFPVEADKFVASLPVGSKFTTPLASFSSLREVADRFGHKGTKVFFILESGSKSIWMLEDPLAEDEHVVGGEFEVVSVKRTKRHSGQDVIVTIRHTGVFDPTTKKIAPIKK